MNMMFSCLFGVGYVVVRYRKSGFLKRLHATPLTAFEFLTAQVLSRLVLILFVTAILYCRHRHHHPLPQCRQRCPARSCSLSWARCP